MRLVIFYHSLLSDWNHGNAHFLRGVVTELSRAATRCASTSRATAGAVANLVADHGARRSARFARAYPAAAQPIATTRRALDLDAALDGADLVLVHEWNDAGAGPRASARIAPAAAA